MNRLHFLKRWETVLAILLIGEILVFGAINPAFLRPSTLLFSTSDFVHIGIVALALTLVIITGGIDLSIGAVMGLAAITLGLLWVNGVNIWIACFGALCVGCATGVLNSVAIHVAKVNPLVITLGSSFLFSGAALVLSGLGGASGYEGISGFDASFVELANLEVLGLPFPLVIFFVATGIFMVILHRTRFGRYIYLIGQNDRAARYAGVPQFRTLTIAYALTGIMAALSGLVLASYFGSARSDFGSAALMPAITAVVLGGTSIYGGSGTILGTALAALLVGYFQTGLQIIGVSSHVSNALSGGLLVLVVALRSLSEMGRAYYLQWRVLKSVGQQTS
ncbi:autoinducer 2 import system permease LsrD [Pseudovibrio exalbescens]|uniref:ABC transporter permease subunit n=1 Tax=Pseudovibrio exalbescens TaxID=197461 RepID=UPI002365DF7F|nr:autoinducer 2 import system permease LsrD [Pseudovibrio exalbescens]MDD7908836.1 autoinducer 2 import system permease LsrD [Pseudovibrio exalbescens]